MPTLLRLIPALALIAACGGSAESTPDPVPVATGSDEPMAEAPPDEQGDAIEPPPAEPMSIEAPADVAAPPPEAEVTASGLATRVLRPGTGSTHPGPTTAVTVHYVGWTTDGNRFDSSIERGEPATFPLNRVIAGWTEGLQLMVEGERRRLWIPEALAYQGRPNRPPGMLVFDVELISIDQ